MRTTKISQRIEWIKANIDAINAARTTDHSKCKGNCQNGATCKAQSGGGWGFWAQAFQAAGVEYNQTNYWSGTNPTPSTSINKGIADYVDSNTPESIRLQDNIKETYHERIHRRVETVGCQPAITVLKLPW